MSISTFDTLKYVRRLERAGMSLELAEAQAEVLTEAFNVNLDQLVTKDYFEGRMTARFSEQDARIDKLFAEQGARFEKRFAEQDAKFEKRFAEQDAKFEKRFAEQRAYMDVKFAEIDAKFRFFGWTQAVIVAAVIIPYIERLIAL